MSGLIRLLRKLYPAEQYALFEELRNGTGWSRGPRSADAVAFSLWPSRGLELNGFECKVSRSDWKRELGQPEKAEEIQQFCDRWWIVISDPKIVDEGELPPTWGLLAATKGFDEGSKLRVVRAAPKLKAKPLDRLMLASMFRNLADSEKSRFRARADELVAEQLKNAPKSDLECDLARVKAVHERLVESVRSFEQASGINVMGGWEHGRVGELLELVGGRFTKGSLGQIREAATRAVEIYTEAAEGASRAAVQVQQAMDRLPKKTEAA